MVSSSWPMPGSVALMRSSILENSASRRSSSARLTGSRPVLDTYDRLLAAPGVAVSHQPTAVELACGVRLASDGL